jgi:hypothetical protein
VPGVLDHPRRRVAERGRDLLADRERQGRVRVGPEDDRRPLVGGQRFGDRPALRGPRRLGLGRQDQREGTRSGLRLGARIGRLVGGDHVLAGILLAAGLDQEADRHVLVAGDVVAEFEPDLAHLLVAGERAGVHDHDPREALGVLDREPQADRPAPVMDDGGGVSQVELLDQGRHQLDVTIVGVPVEIGGLVGAPEAGVVRGDAAVAGVADRRNHLAPEERPGRLAVEEDDGLPLPSSI